MLFNSFSFVLLFLPVSLIGYYILSRWKLAASAWLAGLSVLFYAWWNPPFVFLLLGSITFNYLCGHVLQIRKERELPSKGIMAFGVTANLSLLAFFKYLFPFVGWFNAHHVPIALPMDSVILPLGISFFTFTQIGYLVDCESGVAKNHNPIEYILFVTFFPHLIAGPILHHRDMMPQFEKAETYRYKSENMTVGLTLFFIGLFKKAVIADSLAPFVKALFPQADHLHTVAAWAVVLAYCLQLYFDFSGYSDMAIGLARMFGIRFPANFNSPYKATSIIDFWQRWHMTLTHYMNLYLYNPIALAIARHRLAIGKPVSKAATATVDGFLSMIVTPTVITMAIIGVWHGAGIQFLLFGLMHGTFLVFNHAWRSLVLKKRDVQKAPWVMQLTKLVNWGLTFGSVMVGFVMFRADGIRNALQLYGAMLGLHRKMIVDYHLDPATWGIASIMIVFGTFIAFFLPNTLELFSDFAPVLDKIHGHLSSRWQWKPNIFWATSTAVIASIAILHMGGITEFLYFRF